MKKLLSLFVVTLLLSILSGCAYTPKAINMDNISDTPEPSYSARSFKPIILNPIVDYSKLPQNVGYAVNLSETSKGEILVTNPPAAVLYQDLSKFLKQSGFKVVDSSATADKTTPILTVVIKQFKVSSKKFDWFRHIINAKCSIELKIDMREEGKVINKNAEVEADQKVLFRSQSNYEETANKAWKELLKMIVNDDNIKKYGE